jgi:alpha-tubulin suppressor-like RCC1 family protein
MRDQPSPKRVEALRGVRVSSISNGYNHTIAITEENSIYAWGLNKDQLCLGNPNVEKEMLPNPIEALRDLRIVSTAIAGCRSYAVADTGELWA